MAIKFLKENGYPCDLVIESKENKMHRNLDPSHDIFINGEKIDTFKCPLYERRLYAMGFFKALEWANKI